MSRVRFALLLVVISAFALSTHQAEVASVKTSSTTAVVILDPAETASSVWRPVRDGADSLVLNAEGEARLDLSPDIRINPHTRLPEVVWVYDDGGTYQIAWSRFDGTVWTEPSLLTASAVDNATPVLSFAEDGARAVAWRRDESPARIWYREEDPSLGWSAEIPVSDGMNPASGPSIVFHGGDAYVSFHEEPIGSGQSRVMVARGGDGGEPWPATFDVDLISLSPMTGDLSQEILAPRGRLYTVWVQDGQQLGYSRFDGVWQPLEYEPYQGVEEVPRAKIRVKGQVLR